MGAATRSDSPRNVGILHEEYLTAIETMHAFCDARELNFRSEMILAVAWHIERRAAETSERRPPLIDTSDLPVMSPDPSWELSRDWPTMQRRVLEVLARPNVPPLNRPELINATRFHDRFVHRDRDRAGFSTLVLAPLKREGLIYIIGPKQRARYAMVAAVPAPLAAAEA